MELDAAVARLRGAGVVAFPTDTVTGLGCLAASADGVRAVFALKGRPGENPLTLFVDGIESAAAVTGPVDSRARAMLRLVWPGAVTAVLPLAGSWPEGVGRAGTVGVRVPAHPVPRALVRLAGGPLATTSANASGEPPLADAAEAAARWGDRVVAVPGAAGTAPPAACAIPSTVVDLTAWPPRVLREGAVSAAAIAELARECERASFL